MGPELHSAQAHATSKPVAVIKDLRYVLRWVWLECASDILHQAQSILRDLSEVARRTQGMHIVCHGLDTIWKACDICLDGLRPVPDPICAHEVCPPICTTKCSPHRIPTRDEWQIYAFAHCALL